MDRQDLRPPMTAWVGLRETVIRPPRGAHRTFDPLFPVPFVKFVGFVEKTEERS
jgi:hypothetical protein